jgi:hypothetical protein
MQYSRNLGTGDGIELVTGLQTVSVAEYAATVPPRIALHQNYPNPFNPVTTIGYSVGVVSRQSSVVSNVRLSLYDLLGREVAVLVNEKKEPGEYLVKFDGSRLPSGMYLCRLESGDNVQVRKLMLLK